MAILGRWGIVGCGMVEECRGSRFLHLTLQYSGSTSNFLGTSIGIDDYGTGQEADRLAIRPS
jgi:hypothetical protein